MNKKIIILMLALNAHYLIQSMNTQPIVINKPGLFSLVSALDFALSFSGQACIVVDSNDVVIDMAGFSIRQALGFEQPDTTGILINPGMQNITIKDGFITNMTSYGIHIMDNSGTIYLTKVTVNGAVTAGIFADSNSTGSGITNLFLDNVTAQDIINFTGEPAYGILLKFVDLATILNQSIIHHVETSTGNCYGLKLKNCTSMIVDNIVVDNNISAGLRTFGLDLVNSENCQVKNSFAINNTCTSADPAAVSIGFEFDTSNNIICESCIAIDNSCSFSVCGFHTSDGNGFQFLKCESFGNTSTAFDGLGFSANNGLLIELHECVSDGNGGANNGYGIFFNNLFASAIQDCNIRNNTGFTGTSYGINLVNTTTSYIANNTITYNIGGPTSFGLFDDAGAATTNIILSNIAIRNETNYSPGAATIPIYVGTLATFNTASPFTFQNVSI